MKQQSLALAFIGIISASTTLAQVDVVKRESADKSTATEQIAIGTMDRSVVPLTIESKQTQVNAETTRTESTARARLNDGSYFDWRSAVTVQRQIDSNHTERVQNITENDREGGTRVVLQIKQETVTTPDGQQSTAVQYRRDSSGAMTLDRVTTAMTSQNPDGATLTTTTEQVRDVNGNLQTGQRSQATVATLSSTEKRITTQVQRFDHMEGRFAETARETANVRTTDSATRTERVIQQPSGAGWQDVGRVVTTEARQPDGTMLRETIEEGQSLYSKAAPTAVEPLRPARKIVEREVARPDGTTVAERDVFRRDINGDWKPVTFSTDAATVGP